MIIGYIKEESCNKLFRNIKIKKHNNNFIIMVHNKHKIKTKRKLIKIAKKLNLDAIVFSKELEKKLCSIEEIKFLGILLKAQIMKFTYVIYTMQTLRISF